MSMSLIIATSFKFTPRLFSPVSTRSISIRCKAKPTNYTSYSPIQKVVVPFVSGLTGLDWVSRGRVASRYILDYVNRQEIFAYFNSFHNRIGFVDIGIFISSIICWMIFGIFLRRMYASESKATPFEKSFWSTLEEPLSFFNSFLLTFHLAKIVAPTTIPEIYSRQTWIGAFIISSLWIIHRFKTSALSRVLTTGDARGQQTTLLALDKLSSLSMLVLGLVGVVEAFGLSMEYVLAIGGVGGIVAAFAAKGIIENVLGGLFLLISLPFSIGDTIMVGSWEGQVIEMGLTTITLLNEKQFPVVIPNSMICSQVIVNYSRASWHAISIKLPVQVDDFKKIRLVSEVIKSMLERDENVFLGKESPYCYLSAVNENNSELCLGCHVKKMTKRERFAFKQEIVLQVVDILKSHDVKVGGA